MAHVRHIRTDGFPDAGVQEEGWYSVVVASMTGNMRKPTSQVVHLVSLEHYDATVNNPQSPFHPSTAGTPSRPTIGLDDRVGVVSLHSWIYSAVPQAVDFVATMKKLTERMQPLRPPESVLTSIQQNIALQSTKTSQRAAGILYDRLMNSYTISRWRTATGEETVAFNRGPLVACFPSDTPAKPVADWQGLSMSGKEYQIFDEELGIMDLTYSSAWSLGRLAAISDSPFNAALLRFRSLNWKQSASNTRMQVNGLQSSREIVSNLPSAISGARSVDSKSFKGPVSRILPPSTADVAPPLTHPVVRPVFKENMLQSVTKNSADILGENFYSDFQLAQAANTDWELIHHWISDSLYLAHISGMRSTQYSLYCSLTFGSTSPLSRAKLHQRRTGYRRSNGAKSSEHPSGGPKVLLHRSCLARCIH